MLSQASLHKDLICCAWVLSSTVLSWFLYRESQSVNMGVFNGTWTCHLRVFSVQELHKNITQAVVLSSSLALQYLPSSTAFPPSFISVSRYIFPPTHSLFIFPVCLYLSICVFLVSVLLIPKSPGFYSILFSLIPLFLFSSICLFGRLPFNQREPASCFRVSKLIWIVFSETPLTHFKNVTIV